MTTRHENLEGYGCDVSPSRVQQAGSNKRVEYKLVDMNECQGAYPNGFFDFIFAGDIIEHLENTDNLLIEAVRYLRDGGFLIITTPNLAAWYERLLLLVGMEPLAAEVSYRSRTFGKRLLYRLARVESHPAVGHLRLFTPAALRELGEYYGLVFVEHAGYAHFPFRLNRMVSRTYKNLADGIFMVFKKPQVP
jgi:SAM-dependent methyltransferase